MPNDAPDLVVEAVRVLGDDREVPILAIDRLVVAAGRHMAITGASGSGKTTLIHVLCGLWPPACGHVQWGPTALYQLGEAERDAWRRRTVGLVFQKPHLVPELDIIGNLMLKAQFGGGTVARREDALALIERLMLPEAGRKAALLSQGEQQRVAVARALLYRPAIILADEPTASLDAVNAANVATLLREEAAALGATLICASHDPVLVGTMAQISLVQGRPQQEAA